MTDKAITVKELRKNLNLTQEQFAERLGITRQAVAAYENGKNGMSKTVADRIQNEYGVEVAPVEIRIRIW